MLFNRQKKNNNKNLQFLTDLFSDFCHRRNVFGMCLEEMRIINLTPCES